MTVQNFAAGVIEKGQSNPMEDFVKEFLAEPVDFEGDPKMPKASEIRQWQQQTAVKTEGSKVTRTVTRTYTLANGSKVKLQKISVKQY